MSHPNKCLELTQTVSWKNERKTFISKRGQYFVSLIVETEGSMTLCLIQYIHHALVIKGKTLSANRKFEIKRSWSTLHKIIKW